MVESQSWWSSGQLEGENREKWLNFCCARSPREHLSLSIRAGMLGRLDVWASISRFTTDATHATSACSATPFPIRNMDTTTHEVQRLLANCHLLSSITNRMVMVMKPGEDSGRVVAIRLAYLNWVRSTQIDSSFQFDFLSFF